MGLPEQHRLPVSEHDAGYAMAGLLVALAIMGIVMSMIMPTWRTWITREREAELIFRGQQYMRAIELYQRQFAGAYPTDVETLVDQRFLRKAYTDPMTAGGQFEILTQASVRSAPGLAQPVAGTPGGTQQQSFGSITRVNRNTGTGSLRALSTEAVVGISEGGGDIIGVVSSSTETSMALYNGRNRYDEWLFVYLPQAAQPGQAGDLQTGPGEASGDLGGITSQPGNRTQRAGVRGRGGDQRPRLDAPQTDSPGVSRQRPRGDNVPLDGLPRR